MNCDWISRKCCPFWPFALKAKDDAKYQFDPNNHIKIEPKAEEKEEMKEISNNDNQGMNINKGKERKNFFLENPAQFKISYSTYIQFICILLLNQEITGFGGLILICLYTLSK